MTAITVNAFVNNKFWQKCTQQETKCKLNMYLYI